MLRLQIDGRFSVTDARGEELPIKSRKARALLAYLALPAGKIRSREEIMALLWSERGEEQARGSLRQVLSALRKELGAAGMAALQITDEALSLDPAQVLIEDPAPGDQLLAGLQINDPAFDDWLRDARLRREDAPSAQRPETAPDRGGKPSIVVLPFANLSADPEQQYFSDGITQDIMTELSRFGSFDVLARQSAFVLRDHTEDIAAALAELDADYRFEGSLRKAGTRIRLTAQLIDAETQKQVWADRYDRELADVFAIQDELVRAIVGALVGRLVLDSSERSLRKPPENLDAYDYYLRGLWHDRKYDEESVQAARLAVEKAIALDPSFARAYGLLTHIMITQGFFEAIGETDSDRILAIAKRAVELDPTDGDCFAKLAIAHIYRGEHEAARQNIETALSLNPHDPYIWTHYAWYLETVGEAEEALSYLDRALALDPHPPYWHWDLRCETLYALRRYAEVIEILEQKSLTNFWDYGYLAACYGQLGKKEKAQACWRKALSLYPEASIPMIGNTIGYKHQADADHWTEGLLKAGLSD